MLYVVSHIDYYFMGRASGKELDLVNRWHHQGSSHRSSPPHYQSGSVRHRSHNTGKVRTFTDAQILQQSTAESFLILWYYSNVNIRSVRPSFRSKSTIWATPVSDRPMRYISLQSTSYCKILLTVTGLNGGQYEYAYLIVLVLNHPCTAWHCGCGAWSYELSFR